MSQTGTGGLVLSGTYNGANYIKASGAASQFQLLSDKTSTLTSTGQTQINSGVLDINAADNITINGRAIAIWTES